MKHVTLGLILFFTSPTFASPTFTNITSQDFEEITKEMSANFTHNSMLGASKMGTLFGVQVGLVGASTASPKTNEIVKRNAGADLPNLYNGGLIAAVGIPFGIALEATLFPETSASGAKISSTSFALKYNINDIIPILPVNVALRGLYSDAKFSFSQTANSINSNVDNKTSVTGLQLLVSPMLPIIEPYVGIGILNGTNTLDVSGGSVFDPSFSTAQSEKKSVTSTQILAGVDLSLLLLKIGAEYSQSFGASRYGIKLSLGF